MVYPDEWTCPLCKTRNLNKDFCSNCAYPKLWHCLRCKREVHSQTICPECGYNAQNPEKSKTVVKKSDIVMVVVAFYILIMIGVIFYILTQDKISVNGELLINEEVSFNFFTFQKIDNALFKFTSPEGEALSFEASSNGSNYWKVSNITFAESGLWTLDIEKSKDSSVEVFTHSFRVNSQCTLDEHCALYGTDYRCNKGLGVCIQHKPDMFDFLDVILPQK